MATYISRDFERLIFLQPTYHAVCEEESIQEVIDEAAPGDHIILQPGATWTVDGLVIPMDKMLTIEGGGQVVIRGGGFRLRG